MNIPLYSFSNIYSQENGELLKEAIIVKRPSVSIKSPYVADIVLCNSNTYQTTDEEPKVMLAHSPSLGCSGLCEKNSRVVVGKSPNKESKCEYVIYLSILENGTIVATHPKLAERCVEFALTHAHFSWIRGETMPIIKRETKIKIDGFVDSRFDFSGMDGNGVSFILEVKSVPMVITHCDGTKTAYFPEGYRKKNTDVISERALKHVRELEWLKQNNPTQRFILCFVVQRNDVCGFRTSITDPMYKLAVKQAHNNGVEIFAICIKWTIDGFSYLINDSLPIEL